MEGSLENMAGTALTTLDPLSSLIKILNTSPFTSSIKGLCLGLMECWLSQFSDWQGIQIKWFLSVKVNFRYHMFLNSLAKTCKELGLTQASEEYSLALESILSTANHTNTMMWIGKMENCPLDLSGQGQLLKHGKVFTRCLGGSLKKGRRWSGRSQRTTPCHLFLFQQTVVLCRIIENNSAHQSPHLHYLDHIRQVDYLF